LADSSRFIIPGKTKPYVMAHRGNKVACPENTLSAFQRAFLDGADILETDLRLSSDGHIFCLHDGTVNRTTDGHGRAEAMTMETLKGLSAGAGMPGFETERIPLLDEVFEILPHDCCLALELKSNQFTQKKICEQLVSSLRRQNLLERTVIISFSMPRLLAMRSVEPTIMTGLLSATRLWPHREVDVFGTLWPNLFINPILGWIIKRRKMAFCPIDTKPDKKLWYYKWLQCDAILTDNSEATCRALNRSQRAQSSLRHPSGNSSAARVHRS